MDKSILWESFTQVMVTNWAANIDKLEVLRSEAEAFLQANPKKDLYPVWFNRQCDDMEFCFLLPLSEDELMKARLFVEEDDDPISWDEGFCESLCDKVLFPISDPEEPWSVKEIGFTPTHVYGFSAAILKDRNAVPQLYSVNVPLTDEEYTVLLTWRLYHNRNHHGVYSFNQLRHELPTLQEKIATHIEHAVNDMVIREEDPYAVFMDELEENVSTICESC